MKSLTIIALLCVALRLHAEEPNITVYQTVREDSTHFPRLMLKLDNPTDRPYYALTFMSIADIQVNVEHQAKSGQWFPAPWVVCGRPWQLQKILPHSYIIFEAGEALLYKNSDRFRVRVELYTEFRQGFPQDYRLIPHIELYSPEFEMSDFRDPSVKQ